MQVHEDHFPFFNKLSGQIQIQLSEPPEQIAPPLQNMKATASARLLDLSIEWEVFENEDFRSLTDEEWSRPVLLAERLLLRSYGSATIVEHVAPDGVHFTVRDLAAAVERTERESRGDTEWFGGIDVHHV